MNEYISRIEKGEYELVVRCDDYKQFKSFENLIREEMDIISNGKSVSETETVPKLKSIPVKSLKEFAQCNKTENKCGSCKCKSETQKSKENENLTDAEITLLKIASISDNPLYLMYVYNYFKQK